MQAQIIGAIICWVVVFVIAWMFNYSLAYAMRRMPDTNFFVWLTGVVAAMFGTMLTLANLYGTAGAAVVALILAMMSWWSRTLRQYMGTVLLMAVPGLCVGIIGSILMHLSE